MSRKLQNLIKNSKNLVFFTGAGISTNSGIPDFRGPKGVWKTATPIYFQDFITSKEKRIESWDRKFSNELSMDSAKPNNGHFKLAEIINRKDETHLITQNVDNLHQESGIDNSKITELHGNATYAKCLDCSKRYELDSIKEDFLTTKEPPVCNECMGVIKTATISFGQAMPEDEMMVAANMTEACDLMIVLGSSLTVYPAAAFPEKVASSGRPLVIINREPTLLDNQAFLRIGEGIGKTMSSVVDEIKAQA